MIPADGAVHTVHEQLAQLMEQLAQLMWLLERSFAGSVWLLKQLEQLSQLQEWVEWPLVRYEWLKKGLEW